VGIFHAKTRRREGAKKEKTDKRRRITPLQVEEIAREVVDCGYSVHTKLGPGLLESVYEVVLAKLLTGRGFCVERQKAVPIIFEGLRFEEGFRADLLVEGKLLVEIKSVVNLSPVHGKQVLTYLRLLDLPLGLLMNFGAAIFKNGIKRIVNNHSDFASSRLRVHRKLAESGEK
jgi:iron complex transport system substrate-binding protein